MRHARGYPGNAVRGSEKSPTFLRAGLGLGEYVNVPETPGWSARLDSNAVEWSGFCESRTPPFKFSRLNVPVPSPAIFAVSTGCPLLSRVSVDTPLLSGAERSALVMVRPTRNRYTVEP